MTKSSDPERGLRLDGQLWIAEPTARIQDLELFKRLLEYLGFDVRRVHSKANLLLWRR
jgi:hypothetical protein